ncbi:MFS transporter [Georgenia sp. TF02-10]|uniref:MFS transporter n=1 Tax=Georgenia sp. TF02-10 TaxID=2917725 RepID=UPI001FA81097|nr:MFS transporter [Georgenia sp. TF02-10]UNX55966.1 MFS transporter [Georgenia sp. TF02-10]
MSPLLAPAPRGRAAAVWGAALAAYVVAVTGRTSFGVAGLQAADRFQVGASSLALFVVVQLAVYAAAQLPVGILLDRFGSRRLLAVGAAVLAAGQLILALADTLPLALVARVLVGTGDATAFVSVLRLVPAWFPARRVPLLTQLTGIIGQTGQIVSAVPFLALLLGAGWTPAFLSLAAVGVLVGLLVVIVVRDRPTPLAKPAPRDRVQPVPSGGEPVAAPVPTPEGVRAGLRAVLAEPGAWLGFCTHFVCLFPTNTFMLLWGVPFLTAGQGVSPATASGLLSTAAVAGIVTGPLFGELAARHPLRRSWLVIGSVAVVILMWALVLLPATPRPTWQLVGLVLALTLSSTASNVGFDFARTSVPPARLGTATGFVNVGGFAASLLAIYLVGLVLDLRAGGAGYTLDDFRAALATQALLWAVGLLGVLLSRRAARRQLARRGVVVPALRDVLARRRAEGRG